MCVLPHMYILPCVYSTIVYFVVYIFPYMYIPLCVHFPCLHSTVYILPCIYSTVCKFHYMYTFLYIYSLVYILYPVYTPLCIHSIGFILLGMTCDSHGIRDKTIWIFDNFLRLLKAFSKLKSSEYCTS